ncbi:Cytochrome c [Stieleria maiorica]|uniref:Cytochrome c n=1 Tax=Stieleria maiorica TaxID=2795974 RepID=A0A5B9MCU6_9BACT|nr:c-type cytochrome [Stieleria maiorica]QEF97760.1 Cytochrome c [Stieleria maiorica]
MIHFRQPFLQNKMPNPIFERLFSAAWLTGVRSLSCDWALTTHRFLGISLLMTIATIAQSQDSEETYTSQSYAEITRLGEAIIENTREHPLSRDYIGNQLNCTSCHLENGRHPMAASFIGIATAYPAWSPREKRVITLQDRVLNCFMRSQNGTRPPVGSKLAIAITAYITSLSEGQPIKVNRDKPLGPNHMPTLEPPKDAPSIRRGRTLYAEHCASCHAADGLGGNEGPPVWGPQSYNDGAGLSRVSKLASYLKVAMPLDDPHLSDQEAFDLAAFVNSHPRPKFNLKKMLPTQEKMGEYNGDR